MPYRTLPLILLVFLSCLNIPLLRAEEEVKITSIPVSDNLYMLTGKGGNIGVFLGEDGTFIIDDQFAPLTDKILAVVKSLGGDTPRFLLNTHFHGDHTGGNENIAKTGALIISHDNVRKRLVNGSFIQAFDMKTPPLNEKALPSLTFSQEMRFHINGELIQAIHVSNAHTDGDSFIHFENANVVHTGDVFFNGFYPFIDAAHGGSLAGMIRATDAILAITNKDSKIIPGHGPLADKAQLKTYRDMLNTVYTRLLKLKNHGVSVDEAILRKPLADLEALWGGGIFTGEKWIKVIYPGVF